MKVCKPFAEFKFFSVDPDRSVSPFSAFFCRSRKVVKVYTKEPSDPCIFKLQESCSFVRFRNVNNILCCISENPAKHIKEMNTNVCCHSAGFLNVAFP